MVWFMPSSRKGRIVSVELGVVEQRYQAVLEVLQGARMTDVARRYGVARQTVPGWLRRYADRGSAGSVDRSLEAGTGSALTRPRKADRAEWIDPRKRLRGIFTEKLSADHRKSTNG